MAQDNPGQEARRPRSSSAEAREQPADAREETETPSTPANGTTVPLPKIGRASCRERV